MSSAKGGRDRSLVKGVDGLLVSVSDPEPHLRLFRDAVGMRVLAQEELERDRVEALWGLSGSRARSWVLGAVEEIGVHLVRFEPQSAIAVRDGVAGTDADALKVCDFMVRDFGAARAAMSTASFELSAEPATYEVPREGRFDGPDGIKIALLEAHDADRGRFYRQVDSLFSEVLGFSAPVVAPQPVRDFYAALGLDEVFRYEIANPAFEAMVGIGQTTTAVGINYGLSEIDPMIGTIDYGLPEGSTRSLRDLAVLPNRGYLAVRLSVGSATACATAVRERGFEVVSEPRSASLAPWGEVTSTLLRAPHGVLHHAIERASAAPGEDS